MKFALLLSVVMVMSGCAEKRRAFQVPTITIPLQCITSDIVMSQCDAMLLHCKRVSFKHRVGCEQVKAK